MGWNEMEKPWQEAFRQGWEAFKKGSIPIGAVIADGESEVIAVGRNRMFEIGILNPKMAHAEMECLAKLDISQYPHVREYTLFACMEPCPMCFGAVVMSNLRKVRIAARDSWAGAAHYAQDDPYITAKNMQITLEGGLPETVQLTLQTYYELRENSGQISRVVRCFQETDSAAVELALDLYKEQLFDNFVRQDEGIDKVWGAITSRISAYRP